MKQDTHWEDELRAAVRQSFVQGVTEILHSTMNAAVLAGKRDQTIKHRALLLIEDECSGNPQLLHPLTDELANLQEETAQELAVFLLVSLYPHSPASAIARLKQLADSAFKSVREWTAHACGTLLSRHFDSFYPEITQWITDPSPFIRRTALISAKLAAKPGNPALAEQLLDLIEPLLYDTHSEIRKQLGAAVIGDGFLRVFPEQTNRRLEHWILLDSPIVRQHIVKLFSSAEAVTQWERIRPLFEKLSSDQNTAVQKAVQSAAHHLAKRMPSEPLFHITESIQGSRIS